MEVKKRKYVRKVKPQVEVPLETVVETVVETTIEPVVETTVEPVVETTVEPTIEQIVEKKKRGRKPKVKENSVSSVILQLNIKNLEGESGGSQGSVDTGCFGDTHELKKDDYEREFLTYDSALSVPDGYNEFDKFSSQPDLISNESNIDFNNGNVDPNNLMYRNEDASNGTGENVCFWCCHSFNNIAFGIPIKFTNGKFLVKKCFCSLECVTAYIFNKNEYVQNIWETYSLINMLSLQYGNPDVVKPSPPREVLKLFGGYMTIDEFRNFSKSSKLVNILNYPMIPVSLQIEELTENNINKSFIPLNIDKVKKIETKLKLSRQKPLLNYKNTLDHTMNLKSIANN
jgi:hypothetical protein